MNGPGSSACGCRPSARRHPGSLASSSVPLLRRSCFWASSVLVTACKQCRQNFRRFRSNPGKAVVSRWYIGSVLVPMLVGVHHLRVPKLMTDKIGVQRRAFFKTQLCPRDRVLKPSRRHQVVRKNL
jgi:hypothetical protein